MVSAEGLQTAWVAEVDRRGQVTSVGAPASKPAGPGTVEVRIPVTFEPGPLAVVMAVTEDRWLTGIQLLPASAAQPVQPWQPPPYADPGAFAEQDLTVGDGPMAVPGTLSLPHQPRPCPTVVLLAGSGPQDRDETTGRNKPLKDLAWGWPATALAYCALTRSPTPMRGSSRKPVTSRSPTSTCRTPVRPSNCSPAPGPRPRTDLPRRPQPRRGGSAEDRSSQALSRRACHLGRRCEPCS